MHTRADAGVVEAWLANTCRRKDWAWQRYKRQGLPRSCDARVAVLGLAYKENTHSMKNSPSLDPARAFARAPGDGARSGGAGLGRAVGEGRRRSARCRAGADALVIATPWPQYRAMQPAELARVMAGRIIIDPYRMLDGRRARPTALPIAPSACRH